jgi:hypothetical protein
MFMLYARLGGRLTFDRSSRYISAHGIGIGAPRNTPTEIIDRLDHEINFGLADASIKAKIIDLGGTVLPGSIHRRRNSEVGEGD